MSALLFLFVQHLGGQLGFIHAVPAKASPRRETEFHLSLRRPGCEGVVYTMAAYSGTLAFDETHDEDAP